MDELKNFYNKYNNNKLEEFLLKARTILQENNEEYKALLKEHESILNEYKNLSSVLNNDEFDNIEFTSEEVKILQKLTHINVNIKILEEKEIFFLGARENYFYLKNIGVLK